MKKTLLISLGVAACISAGAQTTATNFTANDCAGTSHTLFNELDAGKVIVIGWAMPCGSCIGPMQAAYTAVQGFSSSHPGRVYFYAVDDYANTSCSTFSSWVNTNGMTNSTKFSSSAISMSDYGSSGMPKVIVLGGANHAIFYNANDNNISGTAVTSAITSALNATTGIDEAGEIITGINVFPNPASNYIDVAYFLQSPAGVEIEIFNMVGESMYKYQSPTTNAGDFKRRIDVSYLEHGIYYVKVRAGLHENTNMISVSR